MATPTPSIVILTQVFPPEIHPTAVMVRQLGSYLASCGWKVSVATGFPHHPYGRLYRGYRMTWRQRECMHGMQVLRSWHVVSPSGAIPVRAAVWCSQALGNWAAAMSVARPDVVVVYGPPLAGPLLGWSVAKRRRAGLVNVVYDLYPDIPIETGKVQNPAIIAAARMAERLQYRLADRTVVLSDGFRSALIKRGAAPDRVVVIPVWLDPAEISPRPRENSWRHEKGITADRFVVVYAGTVGIVSGALVVADVAERLAHQPDILLLVVGDGRAKLELEAESRRRRLANLRFLPFQPRERVPEVLAAADVCLVTLAPGRARTSVPSKVVAYMAAGRPVIAAVDPGSDTAAAIRHAGCGVVTPPGDPGALAVAILALRSDAARRAAMARQARAAFEATYSMTTCVSRFREVLEAAAARPGPGPYSS